jgi:hypothetical protein
MLLHIYPCQTEVPPLRPPARALGMMPGRIAVSGYVLELLTH